MKEHQSKLRAKYSNGTHLGAQKETSNWYYYWTQDVPAPQTIANRTYINQFDDGEGHVMTWTPNANGTTVIKVYSEGGNSGDNRSNYFWCTSKLAHENRHEDDFRKIVWRSNSGIYDPNLDLDGDGLMDAWEIMDGSSIITGTTPGDHLKSFKKWTEMNAVSVEKLYPDLSVTNDWSHGGTNWK